MAKEKTVYVCTNCGQDSPKWVGKCPSCGAWNTYVEEIIRKEPANKRPVSGLESVKSKPVTLNDITGGDEPRIDMHDEELNRVLGGGLVPGSLVLLGGEPGIGKSTLVLQTVLHLPDKKVLYISGEESARQLKLRADRIPHNSSDCLIVCETSLEQIYVHIKNTRADLVIIDSIQTISTETIDSSPGSLVQVRECSASILKFAKETNTPVILIGHINKEGSIAGPKVLEHIVDTVLQFEGDQHYMYRILRSILLALIGFFSCVLCIFSPASSIKWWILLILLNGALYLAIPSNMRYKYMSRILRQTPYFVIIMLLNLFHLKGMAQKFNQLAANQPNTVVLAISKDLPFAQGRFCTTEGITNVIPLSDYRYTSDFAEKYGVLMTDGPLAALSFSLLSASMRQSQS